jgi:hypothetical protein
LTFVGRAWVSLGAAVTKINNITTLTTEVVLAQESLVISALSAQRHDI